METAEFLTTLFHKKTNGSFILIWEKFLPDSSGQELKTSTWFKDVNDAIEYCREDHQSPADLYVGCGVSPRDCGPNRRCIANEIAGIPAVWLDVDILDPAHKKPNLPENEETARAIIDEFPLKPTMIIHSGHGYQCWWVFNQFIAFTKPEWRTEISELVHKFVWSMRDLSRSKGYDLDMTFDLARVMRIPGSKNYKDMDMPVPVRLIENNKTYYDPRIFRDTLENFIVTLGDKATPIVPLTKKTAQNQYVAGVTFTLDPNAEPPKDKLEALCELEPRFKLSWDRLRKDLKDSSPSAYDMSLASFAFYAEWDPQEIVNLLIAWRRKHNLDLKLREDYYLRTLAAASNVMEKKRIIDKVADLDLESQIIGEYNPEMVLRAKDAISDWLKVKVINILKYPIDPPEYKLETAKGCIHLGPIQHLIELSLFRRKVADVIGVYVEPMKSGDWTKMANALLKACITIRLSDDTSNKGILKSWIVKYLQYQDILYDRNDAGILQKPFFEDKYLCLFLSSFQEFITIHCKERKTVKELGLLMRDFGFESVTTNFKIDHKYQSKTIWRIPFEASADIMFFVDHAALAEQQRLYLERKAELKNPNRKRSDTSDPDDY